MESLTAQYIPFDRRARDGRPGRPPRMESLTAQYIPLTVVRAMAVLDGRPGWSYLLHNIYL